MKHWDLAVKRVQFHLLAVMPAMLSYTDLPVRLNDFTQKMLSSIPDDFDGVLLDVPVGTGLFTVDTYRKLKKARIIALDYSSAMLEKAQHLYAENGIENVTFIRGDVGSLPLGQASVDLCLSMNGFHAFADKARALREIARVLKENKIFIMSERLYQNSASVLISFIQPL